MLRFEGSMGRDITTSGGCEGLRDGAHVYRPDDADGAAHWLQPCQMSDVRGMRKSGRGMRRRQASVTWRRCSICHRSVSRRLCRADGIDPSPTCIRCHAGNLLGEKRHWKDRPSMAYRCYGSRTSRARRPL